MISYDGRPIVLRNEFQAFAGGACAIALIVAIWFSSGQQNYDRQNNQPNPDGQVPVLVADSFPRQGANPQQPTTRPEANGETQQSDSLVTKENFPDWVMVVITFFGLAIAIWQISDAKDVVLKTERADILFSQVGFRPRQEPYTLTGATEFSFIFKNFGPTRASSVRTQVQMEIRGAIPRQGTIDDPIGPNTVGAGDDFTITFPSIGLMYEAADILRASQGNALLTFTARVDYIDVFDQPHHLVCGGTYYGAVGSFVVEGLHEAS